MSADDNISRPPISADQAEAFVKEFGKAQHALRAFILSLIPYWDEADEIFQETNLILWRKFGEFNRETDFRKWACQVAYYEILEWRRQRYKDDKVSLTEGVLQRLAEELIEEVDSIDARQQALASCLESLTPADRQLVQLRYFTDISIKGVAQQVGRSADAIYKAINRIRWKLLDCIQHRLRAEGRSQ